MITVHNPKIPLAAETFSDQKCSRCTALCCRYFGLEIDTPEDERDFDKLRWFMIHQQVEIYVEAGAWHLNILTPCRHLQPDNRCGIYETRPYLCRDYDTDGCEFENDIKFDLYFRTHDELVAYMRAEGIPGSYLAPGEKLSKPAKRGLGKKKRVARKSAKAPAKKQPKREADRSALALEVNGGSRPRPRT